MPTAKLGPRILFIDGLPGSGKSTAAVEVGHRLSHSRVFLETAPNHPLLVVAPDRMGAAFANIHEVHSSDSFAAAALQKLESFLERAQCDVQYIFESHPAQSTVRVLFQLDAAEMTIMQFWSELQDRLAPVQPRLVYFQESDAAQALSDIVRKRGPAWENYLFEAVTQWPWMRARALSGAEGVREMLVQYSDLMDRLVGAWRFPMLILAARPAAYEGRRAELMKWVLRR